MSTRSLPIGILPEVASADLNRSPFVPLVGQFANLMPYRWTVAQVQAAVESGILPENNKCELIRGELIRKMTHGNAHMAAVKRLNRWFSQHVGNRFLIGVQDTIELADSLPEPDFTLLSPADDCYESRTAGPDDILLLVEVSDSSLKIDQTVKLALYAENGIREYWIVNLEDERIEVYRQPQTDGRYLDVQRFAGGQTLAALAFPDLPLPVEAVLG